MDWYLQKINPDGSEDGAPVTAQSLGIEDIEFDQGNLAADTWTFTAGGREIDAAELFPYGQLISIQDVNENRVAFGRIEPWTRQGTPDAQNHRGRLVNPWWYLTRLTYQQRYSVTTGNYPSFPPASTPPTYEVFTSPRVILNILFDGKTGWYSATTGQQIADGINWAISKGAPIQLGTVDPSTQPFSDFKKGIMVSDVIIAQWHKEPDFIVDWDYSTKPFPTIHFRKQLTPLIIDLTDTLRREQVEIRERPDWQYSYVRFTYDQSNQQDGATFISIVVDTWPDPPPDGVEDRFGGVDLYCDLTGGAQNSTSSQAALASVPLDITDPNTWLRWKPDLAAGTVAAFTILSGHSAPAADAARPAPFVAPRDEFNPDGSPAALDPACTYELVDGAWADWTGIHGQRVRVTAWAQIVHKNGEIKYEQMHAEPTLISANTQGVSKTYTLGASNYSAYAEPIPLGLARAMYNSLRALAIEGSFTNVEAVIGTQKITRSNCLNFKTATPGQNGCPDWTNVNARVQRISGSFLKGTTKVTFGAPLHITGNQLVEIARATRYRVATIDLAYIFGGALGGGNPPAKFGRKTHSRAAQHGGTHTQVAATSNAVQPGPADPVILTDGATGTTSWSPANGPAGPAGANGPSAATVVINPAQAKGSDGNWHPLTIQEEKVCISINGVTKQRTLMTLASAVYQAPDDAA